MIRRSFFSRLLCLLPALVLCGCGKPEALRDPKVLRVGYFPYVTHTQAVIGALETEEKGPEGWFEKALPGVKIEWFPLTQGPEAITALFAGTLDVTYCGPNPPLNGYQRAKGVEIRLLAGSMRGGAGLVVRNGLPLTQPTDFRGKRIATPQLGNTQDLAARSWLTQGGLKVRLDGGDAEVLPTPHSQVLNQFRSSTLDAAWTIEPYITLLERHGNGHLLVSQASDPVTVLATSVAALEGKGDVIRKFTAAHLALTAKLAADPDWGKAELRKAFAGTTGQRLPKALRTDTGWLDQAWPRLVFDPALDPAFFRKLLSDLTTTGLLHQQTDPADFILPPSPPQP